MKLTDKKLETVYKDKETGRTTTNKEEAMCWYWNGTNISIIIWSDFSQDWTELGEMYH